MKTDNHKIRGETRQAAWLASRATAFILILAFSSMAMAADFGGEKVVTIRGYNDEAMEPFITKDGRFLLFNNCNNPRVNTNIRYARRVDDVTFDYAGDVGGVNSTVLDGVPSLDRNGWMYFVSTRSYSNTLSTIYRGRFIDGVVTGVELLPGISRLQAGIVNFDAEISGDGNTLYSVDGDYHTGRLQSDTAFVATWQGDKFVRAPDSAATMANINTGGLNYAMCISQDGLELFFTRIPRVTLFAKASIWRATRTSTASPFGVPQQLTNIKGFVEAPTLTADGHTLYFHKREWGHFTIRCVSR